MFRLITLLLLTFAFTVVQAETLVVGVNKSKPFMYKDEQGNWIGSDAELLEKLSEEIGFEYIITEYPNIRDLLFSTERGVVDFSMSALSLNSEREKVLDFTHPYTSTGIGVMVTEVSFMDTSLTIAKKVSPLLLGFLLLLYIVGFLYKVIERSDRSLSIHHCAYFALTVFTTVGFGDESPRTSLGKLFVSLWMFICMIFGSLIIGIMSASLTANYISDIPVGVSELNDLSVVTVKGSSTEDYLKKQDISYITVRKDTDAVELLEKGEVKAFVYDKEILDFYSNGKDLNVWMLPNTVEYYGIAFPHNSEHVEIFNIAISKIRQEQ